MKTICKNKRGSEREMIRREAAPAASPRASILLEKSVAVKIMPTGWLLLALAIMGGLHLGLPLIVIIPHPWHLAGILPLLVGVGINLIADRDFQRAATTVRPFEQSRILLTGGVFHCSRNPMYLGFIMLLMGAALLLGSLSPWLVIFPFIWILSRFYVRHEEMMLAAAFGEQWQAYKAGTRRWL